MLVRIKHHIFLILVVHSCSCIPGGQEKSELLFQNLAQSSDPGVSQQESSGAPLRLGDRFYVANVLAEVFGPTSTPIIFNNIIPNMNEFGGPCNIQEGSMATFDKIEDPKFIGRDYEGSIGQRLDYYYLGPKEFPSLKCFTKNYNVSTFLSSSTMREGWRIRTCNEILHLDANVDFAAGKIDGITGQPPSNDQLKKLYQLFYPEEKPTEQVITGLQEVSSLSGGNLEKWRHVLLTLCMSPGWQIP